MSQSAHCPRCQSPLAVDAPEGLCPACLLAGGMASERSANSGSAATTPWTDAKRAATIADLAPHFPQLEIIELLGQGGMGAVYKARQKHLDRLVAIKVIPPEAAQDPAFAERFAREARALARLNHPNIVTVHDFGQSDGVYFLLMEFVDGLNLRQTMRAGKLSSQEALAIVPHVCEALQYAHDQGIVHRDVKPENVLLDKAGRVKIADFGLAKLLTHSPQDYTLTHSMQVMGTPRYMAPEQIEKPTEVDHRADIYSLGVMFYEMLTGEIPMGRFVPPSQKVQIDIRIDEIVLRSLEREPARRYQHASEVKTELESVASSPRSPLVASASMATLTGDLASVKRQLYWPGIGLVAGGVLGLLFSLWLVSFGIMMIAPHDGFGSDESNIGTLFLLLFAIQLPWSMLVLLTGIKYLRMESHRLSLAGTYLALLPISPASLLAIPLGLWGLSILSSRQARDAYRRKELLDASAGTPSSPTSQLIATPPPPLPNWKQAEVEQETILRSSSLVPAKIAATAALSADAATRYGNEDVQRNLTDESTTINVRRQVFWPGLGLTLSGGLGLTLAVFLGCAWFTKDLSNEIPFDFLLEQIREGNVEEIQIGDEFARGKFKNEARLPRNSVYIIFPRDFSVRLPPSTSASRRIMDTLIEEKVAVAYAEKSVSIATLAPVLLGLQIPWSFLIMLAGIGMMRIERYGISMAGAWLSLIPISPAFVLTGPLGLWSLLVLTNRQTREAYRQKVTHSIAPTK